MANKDIFLLEFEFDGKTLTRLDNKIIVGNSKNAYYCSFNNHIRDDIIFTATFSRGRGVYAVVLDDNECVIPTEVLRGNSDSLLSIGLFGEINVNGKHITISSQPIEIPVLKGTPTQGVESQLTPSLFEQIMQKIIEIKKGEVEPKLILEAVNEYFNAHPIDDVVVDEVAEYIAEHAAELKGEKGDKGDSGKTAYQIAVDNGYSGTEQEWLASLKGIKGDTGAKGDTGETPSITMAAFVDNTSGTPNVEVRKTGTTSNPSFAFNFSGLKGSNGSNGSNGINGKSAYQIAVDNGFDGTEEQWLASLKGAKGDKGEDGTSYDDTEIKAEINDIWKAQGELGAKNLITYPYSTGHDILNGITPVDNNGVVTFNGIQSTNAYYFFRYSEPLPLKSGRYILSIGQETTLPTDKAYLQVICSVNGREQILQQIFNEYRSREFIVTDEMVANADYWNVRIVFSANTQIDNLTIAPMIRYATDTDDTWQPYAPSNKTLNVGLIQNTNNINDIYQLQAGLEGENLLSPPFVGGTTTQFGVTITDNGDGSITVNGTATDNVGYDIALQDFGNVEFSTVRDDSPIYKLSGLSSNSSFYIKYFLSKKVRLIIASGYTVDNVTIYPTVRHKSMLNDLAPLIGEYLPINNSQLDVKKRTISVGGTSATFYAKNFMDKYGITSSHDLNLEISAETSSGNVVSYNSVGANAAGVVTIKFDELTEAATFVCKASKIQ